MAPFFGIGFGYTHLEALTEAMEQGYSPTDVIDGHSPCDDIPGYAVDKPPKNFGGSRGGVGLAGGV